MGHCCFTAKDDERIAHERCAKFDAKRKEAKRQVAADAGDPEELKRIADVEKANKKKCWVARQAPN